MAKVSEELSKHELAKLSVKPIVAEGQYQVVPVTVSTSDKEGYPLSISLRLAPLGTPGDLGSVKFHLAEFVNLPIGKHDESHPPVEAWKFKGSLDYIKAAVPSIPKVKRYGNGTTQREIDESAKVATDAAQRWMAQAWNTADDGDFAMLETLKEVPVVAVCKHYTAKDGSTRAAFRYFSSEPSKKYPFVSEDKMEFIPFSEDEQPAEAEEGSAARRRRR